MDRAGKRPASLHAYPNQNENKYLLTVQNGMLSGQMQVASPLAWLRGHWLQTWGSAAGSFISAEIVRT